MSSLLCACVRACAHASSCGFGHVNAVPMEAKEGAGSPGLEIEADEPPSVVLNLSPQGEQCVLLATEPFMQPPIRFYLSG